MLTRSVADVRRGFVWWSAGLAGYVALIVGVWPTVRDNPALADLHETLPEELRAFISFGGEFDYSTPTGYLGGELFSFMGPLLLLVAAIGAGVRALAREEESGTLELLLANPLSRVRLALEKLAALVVETASLAAVLFVSLAVASAAGGMDVSVSGLAAATATTLLLALVYGAIAFALGAGTGRGALAIGVAAAGAVAAYIVNGLAPLVAAVDSIRWLSPWYHYVAGDPLRSGVSLPHALVLAGIAVAVSAAGIAAFRRRDVGVSS